MVEAGVGARLTLGRRPMDMPAIKRKGELLELTGVVRAITDGEYTITGPQFHGMLLHGTHRGARHRRGGDRGDREESEPWDRGVFTSVGIDPTRKRFLLLKSRMYFRPVFLPIASMCSATASAWVVRLDAVRVQEVTSVDLSAGCVPGGTSQRIRANIHNSRARL